eukprot:TRINITY_DN6534_c0_g1_i1.p1 TRINITY_DN6534_c0_g1~~TRINITY_DN6534_c0_g1_i1.p1  ORF type:complete len:462 (-),score=81.59 TRINITY_DN6534_c0_g1_i1:8-1195(-)
MTNQLFRAKYPNHFIQFNDIVLGEEVGQGYYGEVYKGHWRACTVAVKKMKLQNLKTANQFAQEMDVCAKLRPHKNVVSFYGVCPEPLSIVTEFCEYGSLASMLHSSAFLSMPLRAHILRDIAAGMYHISGEGFVHRDLAARNILLTDGFVAKVSDFGLSKLLTTQETLILKESSMLKPLKWMSPEAILQNVYSEKSDVYSYGIVCVEVMSRKQPYPDMFIQEFSDRFLANNLPDVTATVPSECPHLFKEIMSRCLRADPTLRPDFGEIHGNLKDLPPKELPPNAMELLRQNSGIQEYSIPKKRHPLSEYSSTHDLTESDGYFQVELKSPKEVMKNLFESARNYNLEGLDRGINELKTFHNFSNLINDPDDEGDTVFNHLYFIWLITLCSKNFRRI